MSLQTVSLVISPVGAWFTPRKARNGHAGGLPTRLEHYKINPILLYKCYKWLLDGHSFEMQL